MTFLKKIRKAGRKEMLHCHIIPSKPRQTTSGYDMAKAIRRIMQIHPTMTVEQLAEKVCQSPAWINMHIKMLSDLENRLSTMSSLELFRWLKTPPMEWTQLMPDLRKSSDASRSTAENLGAAIPAASKSEPPATS